LFVTNSTIRWFAAKYAHHTSNFLKI